MAVSCVALPQESEVQGTRRQAAAEWQRKGEGEARAVRSQPTDNGMNKRAELIANIKLVGESEDAAVVPIIKTNLIFPGFAVE